MKSKIAATAAALALEAMLGPKPVRNPTSGDDMGFVLHVVSNATAQKYGGFCLDGSEPGYYIRASSSSTQWIYHQRGGAWCTSAIDCTSRAKSDLGSSKYFLPNISATPNIYQGIMTNEDISPFGDYNVVFAQYCDGSSWTSDNDDPVQGTDNNTLWFRGARAQAAVFAELEATHGLLSTATDFVFSGTSAGGLAVFLTAERVRSYFTSPHLNFYAVPDSAWFMDILDVGGNPTFR